MVLLWLLLFLVGVSFFLFLGDVMVVDTNDDDDGGGGGGDRLDVLVCCCRW